MAKPSSLWPRPSALIFLALLHVALPLHSPSPFPSPSPSPSPEPAPADSSPISSPPSPPPSPSPAPSESHAPSPSPSSSSADLSHTGVLDNTSRGGKSEGRSGGRKAGFALAVIVCAVLVVIGGMVYKKRRDNIRRQQYSYSGRGEIQL